MAGLDTGEFYAPKWIAEQERLARETLLQLAPANLPGIPYRQLKPKVMAECGVKRARLNQIAAELRSTNALIFDGWLKGKVPQDDHLVRRGI